MANINVNGLNNIGNDLKRNVTDLLTNSEFISRTIGMSNSYEGIMFIVSMLGREPVSLLGKDYSFIYDHVRRNYLQGTYVTNGSDCPKFTFYKERPSIIFANPLDDPKTLIGKWVSSFKLEDTSAGNTTIHYAESNNGKNTYIGYKSGIGSGNPGTAFDSIMTYAPGMNSTCDIINKTNRDFNKGAYQTLIARFHTDNEEAKSNLDITQTAISKKYGLSHGRNLLKKGEIDKPNGYDNPYCRVWTYHHQYNQMARAIRPFSAATADALIKKMGNGSEDNVSFRTSSAGTELDNYGVLNYKNNRVTIAPTAKIKDYFEHKSNDSQQQKFSTKRCMFSIENLAWKDRRLRNDEYDPNGLSPEQRGPLGGRIMWFPPYDLKFNEGVTVNWNNNSFIGRGEGVYTYTNTERRGNLSFTLLIDHPSILDYWSRKDKDGKTLAPGNSGGVDNVNNQENTLLRFFAGCEILTATPQKYKTRVYNVEKEEEEVVEKKVEEPTKVEEVEVSKPEKGKMYCLLYFPNNYSGKDDKAEFAIDYLMFGVGTQKQLEINDSIVSLNDVTPSIDNNGYGYEMGKHGISIRTWERIKDETNYGLTYVEEGGKTVVKYCYESAEHNVGEDGDWAKIVGSKAKKDKSDTTNLLSEWKMRRWYYRVDKSTENQRLVGKPSNYVDNNSYKLNSTGYKWVKKEIPEFNITDKDDLVSFSDLYVALTDEKSLPHDEGNAKKIKKIFKQEEGYKVTKLTFKGHNSFHGRNKSTKVNAERNKILSSNRALTFKKWMTEMKFPKAAEADASKTLGQSNDSKNYKSDDVNNQYIKAWRSASVIIEYEKSEVSNAAKDEPIVNDASGNPQTVKTEVKTKETSKSSYKIISDYVMNNDLLSWEYSGTHHTNIEGTVHRYDNEGEFFEALPTDAPFLHHLISEKIKYFDPAFHSISPEGFNARLTFLHQCTRQGSTVENNSQTDLSTAYNLSFGRPPVCVLRIGDFYYTKIIINNIDIQYETPQWDLNPEGIGVMPMFANVNMGFTFLGGSDLGGPIARLQNAVSFNYYANTSVYDDRAEKVRYKDNGSGDEEMFIGWNYPDNAKRG